MASAREYRRKRWTSQKLLPMWNQSILINNSQERTNSNKQGLFDVLVLPKFSLWIPVLAPFITTSIVKFGILTPARESWQWCEYCPLDRLVLTSTPQCILAGHQLLLPSGQDGRGRASTWSMSEAGMNEIQFPIMLISTKTSIFSGLIKKSSPVWLICKRGKIGI